MITKWLLVIIVNSQFNGAYDERVLAEYNNIQECTQALIANANEGQDGISCEKTLIILGE